MKSRTLFIFLMLFFIVAAAGVVMAFNISNDPKWDSWSEDAPADNNWPQEYIKLPSAWQMETGSSSIKIGVVDTGFDVSHEDLKDAIKGTGYIDTIQPILYSDHGTHVAGIIGANLYL